jgi:hypothetical protein
MDRDMPLKLCNNNDFWRDKMLLGLKIQVSLYRCLTHPFISKNYLSHDTIPLKRNEERKRRGQGAERR